MGTETRVRVLHVISGLGMGGAERLLLWASRHHDRQRYPLGIISLMSGGELAGEIRRTGVPLVELGQGKGRLTPAGFMRLIREFRRFRPQVLQGHMFHSNILVRFARPLAGLKSTVVNTMHTERQGWRRRIIDSFTSRLAGGFITYSPRAEEVFTGPGPAGRPVCRIPFGIEIPPRGRPGETDALRRRLGLPLERFIWIAVGSLRKAKGYGDLIEAFRMTAGNRENPLLVIVGEGEERSLLEETVRKRGVREDVLFLGLRKDVNDLLAASDAFVLSSRREGNPLVLLEAMAASLPVVATRVGAVTTMAVDGETALLVEPRRPEMMARAMEKVMAMGAEAGKMGEAGRSRLERYYDFNRTQREVEKFYDHLTGGGEAGGNA